VGDRGVVADALGGKVGSGERAGVTEATVGAGARGATAAAEDTRPKDSATEAGTE
jgi:hypothetical protein